MNYAWSGTLKNCYAQRFNEIRVLRLETNKMGVKRRMLVQAHQLCYSGVPKLIW
jgi:hypothetical protein